MNTRIGAFAMGMKYVCTYACVCVCVCMYVCVYVIYIGPFAIGMLVGEGIRRRVSSTRLPGNNDPRRWVYEHVSVVVCMCVCVCV